MESNNLNWSSLSSKTFPDPIRNGLPNILPIPSPSAMIFHSTLVLLISWAISSSVLLYIYILTLLACCIYYQDKLRSCRLRIQDSSSEKLIDYILKHQFNECMSILKPLSKYIDLNNPKTDPEIVTTYFTELSSQQRYEVKSCVNTALEVSNIYPSHHSIDWSMLHQWLVLISQTPTLCLCGCGQTGTFDFIEQHISAKPSVLRQPASFISPLPTPELPSSPCRRLTTPPTRPNRSSMTPPTLSRENSLTNSIHAPTLNTSPSFTDALQRKASLNAVLLAQCMSNGNINLPNGGALDNKQFDRQAKQCAVCKNKFKFISKRHWCRVCKSTICKSCGIKMCKTCAITNIIGGIEGMENTINEDGDSNSDIE